MLIVFGLSHPAGYRLDDKPGSQEIFIAASFHSAMGSSFGYTTPHYTTHLLVSALDVGSKSQALKESKQTFTLQ